MIDVWSTLLPKHGAIVKVFLSYLLTEETFIQEARLAIENISKETTIGPLLNPSTYVGGQRFENADNYQHILDRLIQLAKAVKK